MSLYFIVLLASISLPFILSFDKKVHFYTHWKSLFPAIIVVGLAFAFWDIQFTKMGVWGFNRDYVQGVYLFNLPIEEVLFFVLVPYASVFIYAVLKAYVNPLFFNKVPHQLLFWVLIVGLFIIALFNIQRLYTFITFMLLLFSLLVLKILKFKHFAEFFVAFSIVLVPFLIVNGILTGAITPEPVVWYNPEMITGFRLFTIPIEDVFYGMLMIVWNIAIMEYLNGLYLRKTS